MNKFLLVALLCPAFTLSAQAPARTVGSYSPAPADTPLVSEARTFVQSRLAGLTLCDVAEAYTQVVAGLNVKFVCAVTADDGQEDWQFVAYRSLDGKWHLYSAERIH